MRACSCTFCTKHGGVYTSHPKGRLDVEISDESLLRAYRFGTRTADFHVCLCCGVVAFVTSNIEGIVHAVVNVNTFEKVNHSDLIRSVTDFEGETKEERLERRKRTWIPNVSVKAARL